MTVLGTCIWLILTVTCWRCEGLILAVLCPRLFTSTRIWSRACGPACSFPLERWGMQALKRALRDFSACICAFLPLQKNFLLLFPGCCPLYLSLLVSPCHCQVLEAPGAVSSPHNAGLAAQSLGKNPAWSTAWGCSFPFPGCGSMWKMCAAHLTCSLCLQISSAN